MQLPRLPQRMALSTMMIKQYNIIHHLFIIVNFQIISRLINLLMKKEFQNLKPEKQKELINFVIINQFKKTMFEFTRLRV